MNPLRIPLLLLLALTLSHTAASGAPATAPIITPTEMTDGDTGTASGPTHLQFQGYRVSEILHRLTGLPVDYRVSDDPRIDFSYDFPFVAPEVARSVAVSALMEYVGGRSEFTTVEAPGYFLVPTESFGLESADKVVGPGTLKSVSNGYVAAAELSPAALAALLNEHRSEVFYARDKQCCTAAAFLEVSTVEELDRDLRKTAGVRLEAGAGERAILRVVPRG